MNSGQFLDQIKKAYGLDTDYKLMKLMGWPKQQRISNYRNGHLFDNDACRQVAEKLHLDPLHVIACMESERAKDKERRSAWREIAEATRHKAVKVAAAPALAAFMFASQINGLSPTPAGSQSNPMYIMLRRRRALHRLSQNRATRAGQMDFPGYSAAA